MLVALVYRDNGRSAILMTPGHINVGHIIKGQMAHLVQSSSCPSARPFLIPRMVVLFVVGKIVEAWGGLMCTFATLLCPIYVSSLALKHSGASCSRMPTLQTCTARHGTV